MDESRRPVSMVVVKQELQHFAAQWADRRAQSLQPRVLYAQQSVGWHSTGIQAKHLPPFPSPVARAKRPGYILYTYHGHSDRIHAVAWSPDGLRIASASKGSKVDVWQAL